MRRKSTLFEAKILAILVVPLMVAGSVSATDLPAAAAPGDEAVTITELHYDNVGADVDEFVEVSGPAGTELEGWRLVFYNGSNGQTYASSSLSGTIPDQDRGFGTVLIQQAGIQNGSPDGVALVNTEDTVIQFLSYEGVVTATDGPAGETTSIDIGEAQTSSTPVGQTLQLTGEQGVEPAEWVLASASSGQINEGLTFRLSDPSPVDPPADGVTRIHDIQGDGSESPLDGQEVTIDGVVIGDFQEIATADTENDKPLDGFFVQEEDEDTDGDPATSEGIFVYNPNGVSVAVGDRVEVTGTVDEFFGLTELTQISNVSVKSSANSAPTPAIPKVPTTVGDQPVIWEQFEGMSVVFDQPLTVTGLFSLGSFGEVQLSATGTQDHPNQTSPVSSAGAAAQRQLNEDSRVILEDGEDEDERFPNGLDTWNPEPTPFLGGVDETLRSGDVINELTGVVFYDSEEFEILPVNADQPSDPASAVTIDYGSRPVSRPDVGGSLTVASFNVLNYFTTIDNGQAICGPPGNQQGCRGADTQGEFDLQSAKIAEAIAAIDADIVGLIEIENSEASAAVADLVTKINSRSDRTYQYVETSYIGTDAIAVGFIFDSSTVSLDGDFAVLDSSVSPAYIDDKNRPALAQTFTEEASGASLTLAVTHLKSKGSSCDAVANPGDQNRGVEGYESGVDIEDPNFQGNCNRTRTTAADVLGQWLASDPTGTAAASQLILGDLNAYANEDPITTIERQGFTDLVERSANGNSWSDGAHSYVFNGEHGTLDYAMGNEAATSAVTGAEVWHINADEPFALDYQDFNPEGQAKPDQWKSSDHDPIVVGLNL